MPDPEAPARDDAEPLILGEKYRLRGAIGRGGMGAVFEAEHVLTGRRLAVKVLLPQFAQNEVLAKRFINEARAAAAIRDPHVVEVIDLGRTPEGELYLVLEFLDGRELKAAIRAEAPFPLERAAHIMSQTAALMGRAHALNIVHRDLKPANVFLLSRDGDPDYVKVLDFGIAKLRPLADDGEEHTQLTRTNDVVGTPLYMAPEQLKGSRDVDARADVYSLGVMFYQMLAGRLPFAGESMADIYLKVMTEPTPELGAVRPDLPAELVAVVTRAIQREPQDRFADGAELAQAIAPWAASWTSSTPRTAPGYTPGAVGPVGGTTPGVARARPSPQVTSPVITAAPSTTARPSRAALAASAAVALGLAAVGAWRATQTTSQPTVTPPQERAVAAAPDAAPAPQTVARVEVSADVPPVADVPSVAAAPVAREVPSAAVRDASVAPVGRVRTPRGPRTPTAQPQAPQGDGIHFETEQ